MINDLYRLFVAIYISLVTAGFNLQKEKKDQLLLFSLLHCLVLTIGFVIGVSLKEKENWEKTGKNSKPVKTGEPVKISGELAIIHLVFSFYALLFQYEQDQVRYIPNIIL